MKVISISVVLFLTISISSGQSLMNKIKSKAQQEVKSEINKLGKTNSSSNSNPRKNKLSANVNRSVVVDLETDESFDYNENCIDLGASLNQISFIINKRVGNVSKCISYKNGKRMAVDCPSENGNCGGGLQCSMYKLREINFADNEGKKYVSTKTETNQVQVPQISDQQMKMMEAYMTKDQVEAAKKQMAEAAKQTQGQTYETPISSTINFNGKQYGPFKQILQFFLTPDSKHFYSVVADETQVGTPPVYKIVTSASSTILTAPGYSPPVIIAAPDASEFAMYAISNDQKYMIVTSLGKTYQLPSQEALNAAWYSGSHVICYTNNYSTGNKLYRDGQLIKDYKTESVDPCALFVTPDNKVTEIKNNTILFGDGDVYEFPLKVSLITENGKSYFKWLALEDRQVVVYQKQN